MKNLLKDIHIFRDAPKRVWIEHSILTFILTLLFYTTIDVNTHYPKQSKLIISNTSTKENIISTLNKNGYDVGFIDRFLLTVMNQIKQQHIQPGTITFQKSFMNRIDFLYTLRHAKPDIRIKNTEINNPKEENTKSVDLIKLTLIPGETKEIFFEQVAKKLDINSSKLLWAYNKYANYPEAAISADTYLAPKKMNEEKLIKFFFRSSERQHEKLSTQAFSEYNQTKWKRILIIASIIQKEAANNKEMPLIASVIYNRLKKNMRLQMDGTLNYGKYSHIKVTPERIKTDLSSFNTYKHRGLPDSPIGAVGTHAINAAIHPAKTNYLYFMRNKDGVHDFTDTFKKHRKNIKRVK